jgi:hypothetical protein
VIVKAPIVFPRKDLENIILYAYGRLRKDINTYQNILYLSAKPNSTPLPEVRVVLFLYAQKAKTLSNTAAHFPDHSVI